MSFKKNVSIGINAIALASISSTAAANDDLTEPNEYFDSNAYHLQKDVCTRLLDLDKIDNLNAQQISDLMLLQSLLGNIEESPTEYCEDIIMYRPGKTRIAR